MLEKLVNGQDAFLFQPTSGKLFWLPNIRLSNKVNNERGKLKHSLVKTQNSQSN